MVLSILLLHTLFALVQGGTTDENCILGEQWTKNFVRFECIKGTGTDLKGVRAMGCVPTNSEGGGMIHPGATFNEKQFTYSCNKSGATVAYHIIIGEKRKMSDGSTWNCYKNNPGVITLSQEKREA